MTAVIFSRRARRDVDAAVLWIARDNPVAAQGLLDTVLRAAERIAQHPQIGSRRPELTASPRYRFLTLTGYPYLLVYAVDRVPPVIARVLHTSRNLPPLLRNLE